MILELLGREFCYFRSLVKRPNPTRKLGIPAWSALWEGSPLGFPWLVPQSLRGCSGLCPVEVCLNLPLITIIKIKWCLLCGNFPVSCQEKPSKQFFLKRSLCWPILRRHHIILFPAAEWTLALRSQRLILIQRQKHFGYSPQARSIFHNIWALTSEEVQLHHRTW